jgi:hypothetical protein
MDDCQLPATPFARRIRSKRAGVVAAAGLVGGLAFAGTTVFGSTSASAAPGPSAVAATVAPTDAAAATAVKAAALAAKAGAIPTTTPTLDAQDAALAAFFNAGYTYDDAVALAKLWNSPDPFQVKATAGQDLLNGQHLPLAPGSAPAAPADNETDPTAAFFNAGYTYDDAVALAKLWHLSEPYDAKTAASQKLAAGETLPIRP